MSKTARAAAAAAPESSQELKLYRAMRPLALGRSYHARGTELRLDDKQAEFLLAAGSIELANQPAAENVAPLPAKAVAKGAEK